MLAPGHVVSERYVVEALIGSGGLAHVYRVRHVELGSSHALKVLAWDTPTLAARMLREGRIQAQLAHPHIVRVTDVLRDGGMVGLLMDFVEGETLDAYVAARGPLSVQATLSVMAPVLAAVAAAHDVRVLHRDLKPANVLLERRGSTVVPKVTDFGIAKALSDSGDPSGTRPNAVMGTPEYMAPEQLLDAARVTPAADVYALAAITHHLLTAAPVFGEPAEGASLTERLVRAPLPLPDTVPAALAATLRRAMSTEPEERFPDARAFAQALLADEPDGLALVGPAVDVAPLDPIAFTSATPAPSGGKSPVAPTLLPPLSSQITPAPAPRRSPLALVGAVLLMVAVLVMVGWWSRRPAPLPEGIGEPVSGVTAPPLPPPPEPAEVDPAEQVGDADVPAAAVDEVQEVVPQVATPPAVEVAPAPAVQTAPEPVVEAAPVPDVSPEPEPMDEPPVDVVPEPVAPVQEPPVPAAIEVTGVVAVAEPMPSPEPDRVNLEGRWVGLADGRPIVLTLSQGIDGTVTGDVAFTLGTTLRTFEVVGTVSGERLQLDAGGAFRFTGALRQGELSGTYTARSRGRTFPWSTRRD